MLSRFDLKLVVNLNSIPDTQCHFIVFILCHNEIFLYILNPDSDSLYSSIYICCTSQQICRLLLTDFLNNLFLLVGGTDQATLKRK